MVHRSAFHHVQSEVMDFNGFPRHLDFDAMYDAISFQNCVLGVECVVDGFPKFRTSTCPDNHDSNLTN
jgi:hypothetical protein